MSSNPLYSIIFGKGACKTVRFLITKQTPANGFVERCVCLMIESMVRSSGFGHVFLFSLFREPEEPQYTISNHFRQKECNFVNNPSNFYRRHKHMYQVFRES
ncbi:hypothetical protein C824_004951 [Schaedlerella arabinosiphila]|nr:hypothetical protein C824_004951 [Schaedlerella arabinosiphila]